MEVSIMKKNSIITLLIVFCFILVATVKAEVGVTDQNIKLGTFVALSGPVAFIGIPVYHGCDAYFKMINDRGGINGRKITFLAEDDAYQPAKAVAASKKLVEQDQVFAVVMPTGTPSCVAAQPYLLEKGVPVFWPVSAASHFSGPNAKRLWFAIQPRSDDEASLFVRYAVEKLGKKRIVAFLQNDDFGKDGLGGIEREVKRLQGLGKKVELVDKVFYNIQDADYTPLVLKMKRDNPDVIICYSILKATASLLKTAKTVGLEATIMLNYANVSTTLFNMAGPAAVEGVIASGYIDTTLQPDHPQMKEMTAAQKKYYPKDDPNNPYYLAGWNIGLIMAEGLKRGGKNLTRESFVRGMESLKKWNGSMLRNITYGPDRQGVKSIFMVIGKNGVFERASDWIDLE
jgi:branched-chain amino acid transport system substrate-binding protein